MCHHVAPPVQKECFIPWQSLNGSDLGLLSLRRSQVVWVEGWILFASFQANLEDRMHQAAVAAVNPLDVHCHRCLPGLGGDKSADLQQRVHVVKAHA